MNAVLMDTRRHKTIAISTFSGSLLVPVEIPRVRMFDELDPTRPSYLTAVFTFQGDLLRGDPIYLQTAGPWLPDSWWDRTSRARLPEA